MQTVQQNFASSLKASGLSPRRQFETVKKQSYKPVVIENFAGCNVETVEYPIGNGEVLRACRTEKDGKVEYFIDVLKN
jgi:hypothetical protein